MAPQVLVTVPLKNQADGKVSAQVGTVSSTLREIIISVRCTSGDPKNPWAGFMFPFANPKTSLEVGVEWSWDNGKTYSQRTGVRYNGQPTGNWGLDKKGVPVMGLMAGVGIPEVRKRRPDRYRISEIVINGPISYGLVVYAVAR